MKIFLSLLISLIMLLTLSACGSSFKHIEIDDVESIRVWIYEKDGNHKSHKLTQDETRTFLKLYNSSTYVGKANGQGCTPQSGASIDLKNDRSMFVNEFCGEADIEIGGSYLNNGSSYINNQQLLQFIQDHAQK